METSMEVVHDFPTGGHSFHRGLPKIQDPVICTSLNIASYVDRYDGFTKLQRLIFIAEKCSNLQEEAYRQLLTELKRGSNSVLYMKIYVLVGEILGYGSDADKDWIDSVEKREAIKLERLESELMAAKTTMVKESIRLSYNDIGDLHYERGNLSEAMKTYLRTRDYCTLPKHNSQMCVRVISASMDLGQYGNVMFYVKKADFALTEPIIGSQLKAANALALLIEGQYKEAARKFLEVGIDLGGTFSSVIAAEDVAMYGTLCALASLDRPEIRKSIMENSAFKSFFELAPDVRSLVDNFFAGKYGACLVYLENVKPELLLDIHLSKHVTPLIAQITERIILQYFSPYSSVDMNRMASSLNMTLVKLEKEVASLISSEKISARIDSQSKTLHRRQHDVRSVTMEKVLRLSGKHVREVKRGILRLSILQHGFQVPAKESTESNRDSNRSASSSSNAAASGGFGGYLASASGLASGLASAFTGSSGRIESRGNAVEEREDYQDRMQMDSMDNYQRYDGEREGEDDDEDTY